MKSEKFEDLVSACEKNIVFYPKHITHLHNQIQNVDRIESFFSKVDSKTRLEIFEDIKQLCNFNGLLSVIILDLSVVVKIFYKDKTDWEKGFFIKHAFLILHESCKKLNPKVGKPYLVQKILSRPKDLKLDYELEVISSS